MTRRSDFRVIRHEGERKQADNGLPHPRECLAARHAHREVVGEGHRLTTDNYFCRSWTTRFAGGRSS